MKLKIEIGLGNAAFQGGPTGREVSVILGRFAHIIRDMDGAGLIQFLNGGIGQGHALKDTKGNTVGRAFYTLTIEDREES